MWKFNPKAVERLLENYTIEEIAKKTGYSRQTIYGWRSGHYTPSIPAILKLCNALGLNPAAFFEYDSVKEPKNPPLDGDGEEKKLDKDTQYFFSVGGDIFSITPLEKGFIRLCTYKEDEEVIGYKVKEKIKIKL